MFCILGSVSRITKMLFKQNLLNHDYRELDVTVMELGIIFVHDAFIKLDIFFLEILHAAAVIPSTAIDFSAPAGVFSNGGDISITALWMPRAEMLHLRVAELEVEVKGHQSQLAKALATALPTNHCEYSSRGGWLCRNSLCNIAEMQRAITIKYTEHALLMMCGLTMLSERCEDVSAQLLVHELFLPVCLESSSSGNNFDPLHGGDCSKSDEQD
ncbi:hypothetical protein KSP40_PGU009245 [Platanthera guangdongensis]|uniref:Uncharacterized protein n=1 Tax=Platanthera guangdongensis TaxID=2320717 RepID=A0ABR2LYR8_9ASPA